MKYLILVCLTSIIAAVACDKEPPGPTSADRARCAHIDRETELGEYLYDVCLRNPWPTELPPATQEGLSTFVGIINDTLLFVAGSPRAFPKQTAKANLTYLSGGGIDKYRILSAGFGTYDAIDSSGLRLVLRILKEGRLEPRVATAHQSMRVTKHNPSIDGLYIIDTNRYLIQVTRWDDQVVAGTIDAWFIDYTDSTRQLHLSDGRFDLKVQP